MNHTHPQYLEFVGEQIEIEEADVVLWTRAASRAKSVRGTVHANLRLAEANKHLAAWLAIHEVLVRHEPEIRYALDEGGGSFDSEQELLDSFTEQELKESPPGITTFIICSACGELNTEIQENADEWVYLPEVYFPCDSYLDITKHLDGVM